MYAWRMMSRKERTFLYGGIGLLLGAAVPMMSPLADACSCAPLSEIRQLQLVSADSADANEVARWTETAEAYDVGSARLQVGDLELSLDEVLR
jgi:hypothetical protein